MTDNKKLVIVLLVIVMIITFIIGLFIGKVNDNSIPLQVEIIEVETVPTNSEPKKYTLNQEEIYIMFNIMDNLTYSDIQCDGMSTHIIRYYSEDRGIIATFSLEAYENATEYHISGKRVLGEARLSSEQTEQLSKILDKLYN